MECEASHRAANRSPFSLISTRSCNNGPYSLDHHYSPKGHTTGDTFPAFLSPRVEEQLEHSPSSLFRLLLEYSRGPTTISIDTIKDPRLSYALLVKAKVDLSHNSFIRSNDLGGSSSGLSLLLAQVHIRSNPNASSKTS